jgi:hypothetical protein
MNVAFDYKFGNFIIPKQLVLHTSKYFFTMIPPNPVLKGRNDYLCRHINMF